MRLITVVLLYLAQTTAQASTIARWVQYAPNPKGDAPGHAENTVMVRAVVTDATSCPMAMLDHSVKLTLNQRFIGSHLASTPGGGTHALNTAAGYPQYFVNQATAGRFADGTQKATMAWGECEAVVPPGHHNVTVDGVDLRLPVVQPRRILVMADTGCRMNGTASAGGNNQQNCHSPAAFPLSYLAQYEASFKPDVVLHAGDWFYRDTNCTGTDNGAGSEPYAGCNTPASANYEVWGDTFDSWNADVLFPMQGLLAAAPFIMVRGNHESCGRGARGWFALLDPFPYDAAKVMCQPSKPAPPARADAANYSSDVEPSYAVDLGGLNIIVHDSSFAKDNAVDAATAQNYDIDLSTLLRRLSPDTPVIIATHKPVFGLYYNARMAGAGSCATGPSGTSDNGGNWTEQAVFNGGTGYNGTQFAQGVPARVALLLSGHIHQFQFINTDGDTSLNARFPPQMIVGTGGTLLDQDCTTGMVPNGTTQVANFKQHAEPYLIQQNPGSPPTTTLADTFAHDEFGFAVFDAVFDDRGNRIGFDAGIYTVSAARAGSCRILFANMVTKAHRLVRCVF